jgi:hypothetical protein
MTLATSPPLPTPLPRLFFGLPIPSLLVSLVPGSGFLGEFIFLLNLMVCADSQTRVWSPGLLFIQDLQQHHGLVLALFRLGPIPRLEDLCKFNE